MLFFICIKYHRTYLILPYATMDKYFTVSILLCIYVATSVVNGNGFMKDPPSRSSMWKYGFNSPVNFNHTSLNCGGKKKQWQYNRGLCGMCGDPWDGERENEAGGTYVQGIIARNYTQGETISVQVEITASKRGYFEFRLCPNNDFHKTAECECFNKYLLHHPDGSTKFFETRQNRIHNITLVLPPEVFCSQCVLQWKWNVGNSWGCGEDKVCCTGCGPQEQFYGCADIAIHALPPTDQTTAGTSENTTFDSRISSSTVEQLTIAKTSKLRCQKYSAPPPLSAASSFVPVPFTMILIKVLTVCSIYVIF